jgi:hypothetical protein
LDWITFGLDTPKTLISAKDKRKGIESWDFNPDEVIDESQQV